MRLSRRAIMGGALLGAGALLSKAGFAGAGSALQAQGNIRLTGFEALPKGLEVAAKFTLLEALQGRRSRRFAKGCEIPAGPLAYRSDTAPEPLTELEQLLLLTSIAGNTGWANLIPYNSHYLPHIPNYAAAAGGRSFPSAAGFHTTEFFFTDDTGVYFLPTRDMPAVDQSSDDIDLKAYLDAHKKRIRKIQDGRLSIPREAAHMESHNHWCANVDGSTLVIPVSDLAQHHILNLCYLVQNGGCLFDDINGKAIPGMGQFAGLVDVENTFPLSYMEQISLQEVTLESSISCYAGMLMLQALGLGGWMYGGINPFSVLGASGDARVPGLGFDWSMDDRWVTPNVTGLPGVFESSCPPNFKDMRQAVEAVVARKYGPGGPYNMATPGPYIHSGRVRGAGAPTTDQFIDCVTTMAQYTFDTFGRCPGNAPSVFVMMYMQAHKLDTGFHDAHHEAGSYLHTHKFNFQNWAL